MEHSPMLYRIVADLIVILHLAFVAFALFGGLLVLWRKRVVWFHLPVVAWAAAVELGGWTRPQKTFRREIHGRPSCARISKHQDRPPCRRCSSRRPPGVPKLPHAVAHP
ncbi:MAG: DUF2784 domain-containing protein [Nitrospiraceae bacterium]